MCAGFVLVAGCSGGGTNGLEPQVTTISFVGPTSSSSEADGTHQVVVQLLTNRSLSREEITVTLSDAGSGTATAGADYVAFAPVDIVFPEGSASGTTQQVPLTFIGDTSIEGQSETIQLTLSGLVGDAVLGHDSHDVQIEDSNFATIGFQSISSATADESTAPHIVQLVVSYAGGDTLDAPISVTVSDDSQGNATPGVDYSTFVDQDVVFAASTPSGSTQNVSLGVQDDGNFEVDEVAVLNLGLDSGGVLLGIDSHLVTITNDDPAPPDSLVVQTDLTGPLEYPPSGSVLDFGTAAVGSGPTGKIDIDLANVGTQDIDLSVLNLTGDFGDFTLETGTTSAFPEPTVDTFAPLLTESVSVDRGAQLVLSPELLADLEGKNEVVMHAFPLPDGGAVDLRLTRVASPWAEDAVVAVNGEPVAGGPEALIGEISFWRGQVVDVDGSRAFLSFSEHGSRGWVRLSPEQDDIVHVVTERGVESTPAPGEDPVVGPPVCHVVDETTLVASTGAVPEACSGALVVPGAPDPTLPLPGEEGPGEDGVPATESLNVITVADARLVIETDYQYWQQFGSTPAATTYATQMIAAISDRYETDVQASLSIAYLGIHDNAADGWTTPDGPGDTGDMLDEFRTAWAGAWPAAGDLAHFISGANLGGGIAYVDVLCNQTFGFGVSANINGNINWGTFTGAAGALNWDFVVVAHELGHNFGASHTHSYCPPLDQCFSNCNSGTSCTQGTIMSYCHTCGGMSAIDLEFHPYIASRIRSRIAASCLGGSTIFNGDTATFSVYFEPTSAAGAKSATLSFTHTATNIPSPYTLQLTGTSTP